MKIILISSLLLFVITGFVNGQILTDTISSKSLEVKKDITIDSIFNLNERISSLEKTVFFLEETMKIANKNPKESLWQRSIPQIIGGFIGIGSALLSFYLVMRKENKREVERRKKELDEKNDYLGSLLQSSINIAKKQSQGAKELYEKIDVDTLNIPLIAIYPKQDLERLSKTIDNEEYYHAFLNIYGTEIENVNLYRNIAGAVDFLNTIINQMFEVQSKGQKFDHQRKVKYKELFEKTIDYTAELGVQNQKTNPKLYAFVDRILLNYYSGLNNPFDLEYHQNNLVNPLKEGFLKEFETIPEVRKILNDLKNMTIIYSEIKTQNKIHAKNFKEFYMQIQKGIDFLETDGKKLIKKFKK